MATIAKPTKAKRTHKKPAIPKEVKEAEEVTKQLYLSLTAEGAPKAHPMGYIMGTCTLLKILFDQAVAQGASKEELKGYACGFIQGL